MAEAPANDVLAALEPVVDVLDALGVRYRVGGSVASSALGVPRSTLDVDVACELQLPHVAPFAARLIDTYYLDEDMIRDAVRRQSCCNLIHLATMLKVDLFIRRDRPFEDAAFERTTRRPLDPAPGAREFDLTTPEDIITTSSNGFAPAAECPSGNGATRWVCSRSSAVRSIARTCNAGRISSGLVTCCRSRSSRPVAAPDVHAHADGLTADRVTVRPCAPPLPTIAFQ